MAELALGSIEVAIRPRPRAAECAHTDRITVRAAGVERSICELCGHIAVSFLSELTGPVTRRHFARPADGDTEVEVANPFCDEPRIGVRRRPNADPASLLLTA